VIELRGVVAIAIWEKPNGNFGGNGQALDGAARLSRELCQRSYEELLLLGINCLRAQSVAVCSLGVFRRFGTRMLHVSKTEEQSFSCYCSTNLQLDLHKPGEN